jgi:hypothetical protein
MMPEPVEFSVEDAVLNTWVEDTGLYLRLDPHEPPPVQRPPRIRRTPPAEQVPTIGRA